MDFHQTWCVGIDIVEIWFGIANGKTYQYWQSYLPTTRPYFCISIVKIWFGIADGQISSVLDRVICSRHDSIFFSGR